MRARSTLETRKLSTRKSEAIQNVAECSTHVDLRAELLDGVRELLGLGAAALGRLERRLEAADLALVLERAAQLLVLALLPAQRLPRRLEVPLKQLSVASLRSDTAAHRLN